MRGVRRVKGALCRWEKEIGFKKQHSTADCTFVLKRTVEYYRRNGSHVFAGFIDFNKAFDSVDYWLFFL